MDDVAAELLQVPLLFPESITLLPTQNVVVPLAEITDAVGSGLTVTKIWFEVTLPQPFVLVTK